MPRLSFPIALALATLCAGCSTPVERDPHISALAAPLSGPEREYDVSIDMLVEALDDAFRVLEWGPMHVTPEPLALNAVAVMPNDREADIHAQQAADGRINVQITVGLFGNAKVEDRFHAELAKAITALKEKEARKNAR